MVQLTQKERTLLQDLKTHEELCVQKYQGYSSQAQCPQLQQLFSSLSQKERTHLDSINSILSGQIPNVQSSGQQSGQSGSSSGMSMQSGMSSQSGQSSGSTQMGSGQSFQMSSGQSGQSSQTGSSQSSSSQSSGDKSLCIDMLSTEKHVSSIYDTAIFEFTNTNIRQVLNHIQKEEQEHGEQIFRYMQSKGMYNLQ